MHMSRQAKELIEILPLALSLGWPECGAWRNDLVADLGWSRGELNIVLRELDSLEFLVIGHAPKARADGEPVIRYGTTREAQQALVKPGEAP